MAFRSFAGYEPGDRDFQAGGGERIANPVNGKNHLVYADPLGTDGAAQEYLIEKAHKARDQSGQCENQGACEHGMVLFGHRKKDPVFL
jgi:hypothetical protein